MGEKYFCRNCKGKTNHKLIHEKIIRGEEENFLQWITYYRIVECLGCENISFAKIYGDSEMELHNDYGDSEYYEETTIFPNILENGKELEDLYYLPPTIKNIYQETLTSFKSKSYILTAGGFRAIIEAVCIHLEINEKNLLKKIDSLQAKGFLTKKESKRLHSIRFLGNDALHEIKTPKKDHLLILLEIVNHLLENLFIQDQKTENKIEKVIEEYEKFLKLIKNKITKERLNQELSIDKILGKSKRLIKDEALYKNFIEKLDTAIKEGKIDFLSKIDENIYKIEKISENIFNW